MSTNITVTPRVDGDPQPDVMGLLLAHRTMLRDLRRLSVLSQQIADGAIILTPRRANAIATYLEDLCTSIHHHHSAEDDILWPVIEASAGAHVDLTELSDDHAVLDPKLDRVRAGAAALRSRESLPQSRSALAADLADLRDTLTEHIEEEERDIIPVIHRYVSVADWNRVEAAIRKNGAKFMFEVPRVIGVCTPEEIAKLESENGFAIKVLATVLPLIFRRRERLVFGAAS